jgi:hypothetical protein
MTQSSFDVASVTASTALGKLQSANKMKPLNLLPKTQKYYLQKESKHLVTHHLLHLLPDFSPTVHLFVSLELSSLSSYVLSSHNSSTLSFQV